MRDFKNILAETVLTRGLLLLIGLFAVAWIPPFTEYARNNFQYHQASGPAWDMWARWDAEWYLYIAEKGYINEGLPAHYQDATSGFLPLYPLLIRSLGVFLGNPILAGLLVSNASLLLFLWILVRLGREAGIGPDECQRASWYYLIFPASFFLSAAYAESLFLALTAGAFLMSHQKRWWVAGLLGCLAALCRP